MHVSPAEALHSVVPPVPMAIAEARPVSKAMGSRLGSARVVSFGHQRLCHADVTATRLPANAIRSSAAASAVVGHVLP